MKKEDILKEARIRRAVKKLRKQRPDCPRCGSVVVCKGCKLGNEGYSGVRK